MDDSISIYELVRELSLVADDDLSVDLIDDTYEIEGDFLTLTFTASEELFEIRSIDVHGNKGLGRKVVRAIHDYADEEKLDVVASNVRDDARGFWEKMGYQEGQTEDEFFRAV